MGLVFNIFKVYQNTLTINKKATTRTRMKT